MTLAYFPEILPDELLYSVLARYHRHNGSDGPHRTARALFGRAYAVASYDLPGHLDELAGRIDQRRGLTPNRLLDETTLFPYYAAFQPEQVRRQLGLALRFGAATVHTRIGITGFAVPRLSTLRFCPSCFVEMMDRHGEAYWRRAHQLPGVLVCPDHGRPLQESAAVLPRASRHRFIAADERSCPPGAPTVFSARATPVLDNLVYVARACSELLKPRSSPCELRDLVLEYRGRFVQAGLMRSAGLVDQEILETLFRKHWGAALAELPGVLKDGSPGFWLAAIACQRRRSFHPLCHVLLRGFLDRLPESGRMSRYSRAVAAFGSGPWPCRNPLSAHSGQAVADRLGFRCFNGRYTGTITCRCGYAYTRAVCEDGGLGPPRFRCYGPLLKPVLERLVGTGASLNAAARELGLRSHTVKREAAILGLDTAWKFELCAKPKPKSAADREPAGVRRARRPRQPGAVRRDWLKAPRRDWKALDSELAEILRRTTAEILADEPPVRVTRAEFHRRTARGFWFHRRKRELPLSMAELAALCESLQDFRRRRIRFAAHRLLARGETPTVRRVISAAGLSKTYYSLARVELELLRSERLGLAPRCCAALSACSPPCGPR